jgi:hypothetical protein
MKAVIARDDRYVARSTFQATDKAAKVVLKEDQMKTIPLLKGFYQIGYVARDLDAAVRQLQAIHGVECFRIKRDVPSMPGMPKMVINQAHAFIGTVQIEIIQPAGGDDALYRDFCAADGSAIRFHHFGMWVDDAAQYGGLHAALEEQHIPIVFEATIPNVGGAIYADTRAKLGHYLEYVHLTPEVKRSYYADVPRY